MGHAVFIRSAVLAASLALAALTAAKAEPVAEAVELQLSSDTITLPSELGDGQLLALRTFYADRSHRPLWVADGAPNGYARALSRVLLAADADGLVPDDYAAAAIAAKMNASSAAELADLELMLSHALIAYGGDVSGGRVEPSRLNPELFIYPRRIPPLELLAAADRDGFVAYLEALKPVAPQYVRLRATLATFRAIARAGGWGTYPDGPTLKPGMTDPRVPYLRTRLAGTGDIAAVAADAAGAPGPDDGTLYDAALEAAVKRFQYRHGLDTDGAIGPATRAALNVSVEDRIQQIVLNMERRKWMPASFGQRYVFVNMAGFELKVVDEPKTIFVSRVVVGTPYHRTPVFSGEMSYLVINPYWNITPTIGRNEILPKVQKDVGYLAKNNIVVLSDWTAEAKIIDPWEVDWSKITRRSLGYKFRQDSGPGNALGRVKFMFPNKHNIYLHDTPARSLFDKTVRSFSHGCIRVEQPLELAEVLLGKTDGWDRGKIDGTVSAGKRQVVSLSSKIPVHLTYLTAWTNKDGTVHFRDDIYGRDALLKKALYGE